MLNRVQSKEIRFFYGFSEMLRLGRPRRVKIRGYHTVCGCGGIGRRARFRFLWGQLREGSSPFTRTKKTRGRKTSGFFVGEDLNLVPSEQVPRRLGNMVARGAPQAPFPALPISFGRGGENRPPDAFPLAYLSPRAGDYEDKFENNEVSSTFL